MPSFVPLSQVNFVFFLTPSEIREVLLTCRGFKGIVELCILLLLMIPLFRLLEGDFILKFKLNFQSRPSCQPEFYE